MGTRLSGRTALVTGATSNIGRAIAERFAAEGAVVAVSGRNAARGAEVVDAITAAGGHAVFIPADLNGSAAVSYDLADRAVEALGGRVDVLVNNAAAVTVASTVDTGEAELDEAWAVNVKAPFFTAERSSTSALGWPAPAPVLSWPTARRGPPSRAPVGPPDSKGAIDVLTRNWAAEFGPARVRVNAIAPGVVQEDPDRPDPGAGAMAGTPYGRILRPEAIAAAAVYLASDEAAAVHGVSLDVDGGRNTVAVFAG